MAYIDPLLEALQFDADADLAAEMAAYMKDRFEYFGIRQPNRKAILKAFTAQYGHPPLQELEGVVRQLWQQPQRECQYCAIELAMKWKMKLLPEHIHLFEHMVTEKSWWDTVDLISTNLIGNVFLAYLELERTYPDKWVAGDNMWLQRAAIIYQLKYKDSTDVDRLFRYCDFMADSKEFFIRKAIGWALREYSKTNAEVIERYVGRGHLHPFSAKEAMKWIEK